MKRFPVVPGVFEIGGLLTLAGLFLVTVTFATNDYTNILRIAFALASLAGVCFAYVALSQIGFWRWLAIVSLLPVVYIFYEVVRRSGL